MKYLQEFRKLEQTIASVGTGPVVDTHEVFDFFPLFFSIKHLNTFLQTSDSPVEDFDTIRDDDLTEEVAQSSRDVIFKRLQDDLLHQVQLCARNQQMYAQMEGSNSSAQAKEFKQLELRCARDLERLRQSFQHGSKPPVFHYEKRQMNIIHVNNDLTDDMFEVKLNINFFYSNSSFL